MIEFKDCANYRGALQVKEEGGRFFWRVGCDVDEVEWQQIPKYLRDALAWHHAMHHSTGRENLCIAPQ